VACLGHRDERVDLRPINAARPNDGTVIAGIAEFERELLQERIRSRIAAAKARGKRLGAGQDSDRNQIVLPLRSSRSSLLGAAIA